MIRKPSDVLPQIFRRLVEKAKNYKCVKPTLTSQEGQKFLKSYVTDLPFSCTDAYKALKFKIFQLSINQPDNCCYLNDLSIVFIEYIAHKNGKPVIIGKKCSILRPLPNYPGNFQELDIHLAKGFEGLNMFPVSDILKKAEALPINEEFYILPLMHTTKG